MLRFPLKPCMERDTQTWLLSLCISATTPGGSSLLPLCLLGNVLMKGRRTVRLDMKSTGWLWLAESPVLVFIDVSHENFVTRAWKPHSYSCVPSHSLALSLGKKAHYKSAIRSSNYFQITSTTWGWRTQVCYKTNNVLWKNPSAVSNITPSMISNFNLGQIHTQKT